MWSETGERLPYNPEWAIEPSDNTANATSPVPIFGSHSPMGIRRVDRTVECSLERTDEVTLSLLSRA
jgi:hypothetical protein